MSTNLSQVLSCGREQSGPNQKNDFLEYVTVIVGEDDTKFAVHKNIVCQTSAFFRTALKKEWKEAEEKIVALRETTSEIFGLDNGWLYTGNIDIHISSDEAADNLDHGETMYDDLIHAYALGNYLQDPTFKNAVSDETMSVLENQETIPYPRTINLCWKIVLHDSKLAKMMVDIIALYGHPEDFAATPLVYSMGFVWNLTRVCLEESLMGYQ